MRADRLVATLLVLQARGRVTASQLARELETSVATARRDLEALSAAGIPVYPQSGRGGGWQLLGGARTDLTGLTAHEATALFLLVGPAAEVNSEAKSALRKLVRALPATFRERAEAAAEAVIIDDASWGNGVRERPDCVDELQQAVIHRRQVQFSYTAWQRDPVERCVHPWGLIEKRGTWYLIAGFENNERTYRVDRMSEVEILDAAADRPADFDLDSSWARITAEVGAQRAGVTAIAIVDSAIVPLIREAFAGDTVAELETRGQSSRIALTAPTELMVARRLAGWAEFVTVVEPASLRDALVTIGAQLVVRNQR